jgi:hypothetical protein
MKMASLLPYFLKNKFSGILNIPVAVQERTMYVVLERELSLEISV